MEDLTQKVTLLVELAAIEKMGLGWAILSLRREGYRVLALDRADLPSVLGESCGCWLSFGFIPFIRQARKLLNHQPLAYYSEERFYYSRYAHKIPEGILLNDPGMLLPCATLVRQAPIISQWFGTERFFIRPDSGGKVFTGQDLAFSDVGDGIEALQKVSGLTNDTLVYVAPYKRIQAEYRVFIVNREVISASRYSFEGDFSNDVPDDVIGLADQVAKHPWQVDIAYSCDVALVPEGYRVIELNAGSTSGFYACDAKNVIKAMMRAAWLEYQGELSIED